MFNAKILGFALAIVGGSFLLAAQSRAQVVNHTGNRTSHNGFPVRVVPNPGPIGGGIDAGGKIQPPPPNPQPGLVDGIPGGIDGNGKIQPTPPPNPGPIGGGIDGGGKIQPKDGQAGFALCFGDGTDGKCPSGHAGLKGRGCDNSVFTGGALLEGTGAAKVSKDTLHFQVTGMVPVTTAIFLQGPALSKVGTPFGDGLLCLYGPVAKIGAKSTVYGAAEYPQYGDEPICDKGQIPAFGATRYYQVMYRDEGAVHDQKNHFNLSNGWMTVWVP